MRIKEIIEKLQLLPDRQKKIILWTVVAVLGLIMGFFWVSGLINKLNQIGNELGQIELPIFETTSIETTTQSDQPIF